ncbi:ParB/RepB/Spo0J family partition protein [uncultured Sphaerotilus sp.]|uniref:ParB/RepB/Spo0J family partition protein n=1 Tax=uncultured Sphaerotilus sp. TaxID=474984 RepID=UPI0030CA190F
MVTKKPKGLGRGLEALLGPQVSDATPQPGGKERHPGAVQLDQLLPGKYQPRTRMDEGSLFELAESIKTQGVMQPVLVRPVASRDGLPMYEIIAGERRTRAARLAGLSEVPVLVRDVPDQAAAVMALIENIQREDLNPLEEAHGVQRLIRDFGLTHDSAAQAIGRSRSATSNLLRLLHLAEPVQQMLTAGDIDMGHARSLLSLDRVHQITCANEIVGRKLSVREAEKLVNRQHDLAQPGAVDRARPAKSRDVQRLEALLSDLLTAQVEIRVKKRTRRGEQGEVAIAFGSLDELSGLLDRLGATER